MKTKSESRELAVLHDLSKDIIGASSMHDVCNRILERTVSVLKVNKASIMKYDPESRVLRIIAGKGVPEDVMHNACVRVGEGISGHVFEQAKPVLIKDIESSGYETRKRYRSKSLMSAPVTCFPMSVGGRAIGVINVTDKKDGRAFTPPDLQLLTTIANQTATYLYLCDLIEDVKKNEKLKREMELAREIQQRLLPSRTPKIHGFDIFGRCLTAEKVGGDYFDYLVGGLRPPAIVLADVAGHSVGAAMMMSAFRSAVRAEGASMLSPSIIAERLNKILYEDLAAAEQFISMIYLQIMSSGGKHSIKYSTAGHHPPLILRKNGFISQATEDFFIGTDKYAEYHDIKVELEKGDLILLYTDGLVEAEGTKGKRYGLEKVKEFLKVHRKASAEDLVTILCDDVKRFTRPKELVDDVTVVVIKVL